MIDGSADGRQALKRPCRVAIVNRGEAATRFLHTIRELNVGSARHFTTVALHTSEERRAAFVEQADQAYDLGPASTRPYVDHARLERALVETGADAAWVGWGFVAEDPAFAELCGRLGVIFIGPSPEAMRRLGDKIVAKRLAEEVEVPVAAWSNGPVETVAEAIRHAHRIGYPLMLKAAAGGGGRGIRVLNSDAELVAGFDRARDEARRAFGSADMFLERLVTDARHIEVQLIADGQGAVWALGARDCSVQRRNQKLIEESSSPVLSAEATTQIKDAAVRLARAVGYRGAGTVEFLYQPATGTFTFLEVNTRLQVEHPVTELVTGTDLVSLQLMVADGGRLQGPPPAESGHAVEARLNAEDPDQDFAAAPGRIAMLRLPAGPGIRVDSGVTEGGVVSADFDSMIAKIVAYAPTRRQALARLERALGDTTLVIEGGTTNKAFLLELLRREEVHDASADTGWVDRERALGGLSRHRHAGLAVVTASIDAYTRAEAADCLDFLATARGGRPQARHDKGRVFELELRGVTHRVRVTRVGPESYLVSDCGSADRGTTVEAVWERLDTFNARLTSFGQAHHVVVSTHADEHQVQISGTTHRIRQVMGGIVRSPAPALVVSLRADPGKYVAAGAPVIVLESMKMETVVTAPFAGVLRELYVSNNAQVRAGQPLLRIDRSNESATSAPCLGTPTLTGLLREAEGFDQEPAPWSPFARMRALFLGFDLLPEQVLPSLDLHGDPAARSRLDDPSTGARKIEDAEIAALEAFADLCELSRSRVDAADDVNGRVPAPRDLFHRYLRSLDLERANLPPRFRSTLTRVLAHYGVEDVEHTPALERALFRAFLAQQRISSCVPVVRALLEGWSTVSLPPDELLARVRAALERVLFATRVQYPALADLVHSVTYQWFELPVAEARREQGYDTVAAELAALAVDPEGADRDIRIATLTRVPVAITRFLGEALADGAATVGPLLEVLARRQYFPEPLNRVTCSRRNGRIVLIADYLHDRCPTRLVSSAGRVEDFADLAELVTASVCTDDDRPAVVDLYLTGNDGPVSTQLLVRLLEPHPFAHSARRVSIMVSTHRGQRIQRFTFRPGASGRQPINEDLSLRGLHPRVARQLNLWRLRNFRIDLLDTPDDVVLHRCTAPDNPMDVRLVAQAQVRELTTSRDSCGVLTSLPQLQWTVIACLEAIRGTADQEGIRAGLNQVWIRTGSVVDSSAEELTTLRHALAPWIPGTGVEEIVIQGRSRGQDGESPESFVHFSHLPGTGLIAHLSGPPREPLAALDEYALKVRQARQRGTVPPYELIPLLTRGGSFVEHDLDPDTGQLTPIDRAPGTNTAGLVVGIVTTPASGFPAGLTRVVLLGDPTKALGAVAEPECARLVAALDLAEQNQLPLEWFALSAGARISMTSGTENMDWVARGLRRIIEFTQAGNEINIVVTGINVGAQPYWNAEATMLMHTKGILVMTPDSAMVLTGKQSLDYSGGVSAEDNHGIGGYDRVMGPNGQAQYWAADLTGAIDILLAHYAHTYRLRGEVFPPRASTTDPHDRDVRSWPHQVPGCDFRTIGDIFSPVTNPERKKPFDIRTLMRAVADTDHATLERWAEMADAETCVVFDAHLGGFPVCLLGIESRPIPRPGLPPGDGPDTWTAGTLFPGSSKKAARALNTASGNRPAVILANLSGFDGSPESMRRLQLEYGAEIGRAVVNFSGPMVFCVVSRYHGGAFVVFSKALNDNLTVLALEGSYASVIGGAPAAAIVFSAEVDARTDADPGIRALRRQLAAASGTAEQTILRSELSQLRDTVRAVKLAEVGSEFDAVHSIERAVEVGSVDAIIGPHELRSRLIEAIETGVDEALMHLALAPQQSRSLPAQPPRGAALQA